MSARRFVVLVPAAFATLLFVLVIVTEGGLAEPGWSVSTLASGLTTGCLVLSLIGGLVPRRADVRLHASVVMAIFAMTALGQSRMIDAPNALYRVGVAVFALLVVATWRAPQRWAMRAEGQRPIAPRGRARATAVLAVVWLAVAALLVTQLPPASQAVERRVTRYFEGYQPPDQVIGFSSNLALGATRGMMTSNRIVMRIDGPPVDYLRGVVLDDYDAIHQRWSSSLDEQRVTAEARAPASGDDRTIIRLARSAPLARGTEARWFLPGDACDLRTRSGRIDLDASGIAHPDSPVAYDEISFRSGASCAKVSPDRALPVPPPPGPLDTVLSPQLARQLTRASRAMTKDQHSDRAKLDAIVRTLGRFGYSLDVDRRRGLDAVIDLLYVHQEGHCEVFASAMALLARHNGIPARVVSGYRVSEVSSLGHAVVRERNAHTWVEAWVDGHWESYDPTPAIEGDPRARASRWERVSETIGWAFDRTVDFFWNIGLVNAGIGAAVLAAILLVVRRLTQRTRARAGDDRVATERPLPAFERLTAALARAGWVRAASEPLEGFATRLGTGEEPWSSEAAEAITRYAELRYGGIGEEASVVTRLTSLADRVRHSLRAS